MKKLTELLNKRLGTGILALTAAMTTAAAKPPVKNEGDVKGKMHQLFGDLQKVLPLAIDSRQFQNPKNQKAITASLQSIQKSARYLEGHGNPTDPSFAFVAKSLEDSAQDAIFWLKRGDSDEARFITLNLAENCISCHTNLPENAKYPPAAAFFQRLKHEGLTKKEEMSLLIASRDFDGALSLMEKELLATSNNKTLNNSMVSEYLKVALRVKQDPERARRTLASVRNQGHLPLYLDTQLGHWLDALSKLTREGSLHDVSLGNAQKLIKAGKDAQEFRMDHNGDVYFVAASSILNRLLQAPDLNDEKKSEIFYNLGITEVMIGRSFWLSKAEFYLENAIRLYPQGPHTLQAYSLLEEQLHAEYEGSSGLDMPKSKSEKLDSLMQLLPARSTPKP